MTQQEAYDLAIWKQNFDHKMKNMNKKMTNWGKNFSKKMNNWSENFSKKMKSSMSKRFNNFGSNMEEEEDEENILILI